MQFLRTLFWVVIAVIAVIVSVRNWTPVTLNLWGGLQADVKLPLLLLAAFLLGFLPPYILHRATRWRLRRKLETSERALSEYRTPVTTEPTISAAPLPSPVAAPTAVPPGA